MKSYLKSWLAEKQLHRHKVPPNTDGTLIKATPWTLPPHWLSTSSHPTISQYHLHRAGDVWWRWGWGLEWRKFLKTVPDDDLVTSYFSLLWTVVTSSITMTIDVTITVFFSSWHSYQAKLIATSRRHHVRPGEKAIQQGGFVDISVQSRVNTIICRTWQQTGCTPEIRSWC